MTYHQQQQDYEEAFLKNGYQELAQIQAEIDQEQSFLRRQNPTRSQV